MRRLPRVAAQCSGELLSTVGRISVSEWLVSEWLVPSLLPPCDCGTDFDTVRGVLLSAACMHMCK
jgi:hypothetical protein